ncbi:MAG: hypothetical protein HC895_21070 [Leptolyngbyaceae cyanobacterium SM1_3_5]|nr:hypothetical protein [Leptolyngbyaceae cyanobacterium SM1_3_5]
MILTAGAKLQNGKYLIQSLLHQTDASISYRAMHTSLNHPVVIHTLNPSLQQSPRFDLLRQQFLATVKQGQLKGAIVRDCFEENNFALRCPRANPNAHQDDRLDAVFDTCRFGCACDNRQFY